MKRTIDTRGIACPQPVVMTKQALDAHPGDEIEILSDSDVSVENIRRFLGSRGITCALRADGADRIITMTAPGSSPVPTPMPIAATGRSRAVIIGRRTLGDGDETLGTILIRSFLKTLSELDDKPEALFFVNSGVYLTTDGSPVLDELEALDAAGVAIYSCGTCLDFYHRKDSLKIGCVGNIYLLVELLAAGGAIL